ncbi:MAG: multiheme c-type cytochrome [Ginsengibacter sp.]
MKRLISLRRHLVIISLIIFLCFILVQCIDRGNHRKNEGKSENTEFSQFAGSATCAKCHKQIYDSFIVASHFLTSQQANINNVKGSFEKGKNIFNYHMGLYVAMEKNDTGLYQVEYKNAIKTIARRFDITIGSGERGQTYLSWEDNLLTQLPVSYLSSVNEWANSPGDLDQVYFDRPINSRCLECHTTYAKVIPFHLLNSPEEFEPKKIIYGITCEKCHGPAAEHVKYQTENPNEKEGKYIIDPGKFSRQLSLDLCSLCHGGRIKSIKPTFSFTSGDKLQDYFRIDTSANNNSIDVHGNQYGLLSKSKCFRNSATLTCVSCHNPHDNESGNLALFSQKCMTCHNEEHGTFCKINPAPKNITLNCIDCHMPKQVSKSIVLQLQSQKVPTAQLLRTHFIAIYPEATKDFMKNQGSITAKK